VSPDPSHFEICLEPLWPSCRCGRNSGFRIHPQITQIAQIRVRVLTFGFLSSCLCVLVLKLLILRIPIVSLCRCGRNSGIREVFL
jgi:hypothetical protein